ncbi:hypothetical protein [Macrococcoides bohemicum]|uniref:hypothetical protein n=1 Tax=Macrococcoides bohemicum TaxID=1903056 RepID=UPI00165E2A48|nr:hypothetical protein [Macrococcus bohemicus]MBC9873672.1 hypothetical protein [Macrococcus bohemicus]
MIRLYKTFIFVCVSFMGFKILSKIIDYWITATIPDEIEYYEDDPYFTERKAEYEINNKIK